MKQENKNITGPPDYYLPLCKVGRNALEWVHENTPFWAQNGPFDPNTNVFRNTISFSYNSWPLSQSQI